MKKKFIIKPEYALRSYIKLPHMLILKHSENDVVLFPKEWEFLIRCDGKTEIEWDDETREWFQKSRLWSMVEEAGDGEELSPWQQDIEHNNQYFRSVEWRITDRCNFNCLHCYNAKDESANGDIWELDEALDFLDQARKCGINKIILSGGEPMMHPNFLDIVKGIYDRDMYLGEIVTNGYYLTQEILDTIASYGHKPLFKVSFDGFGYHDWMRNQDGAQKSALRAFDLLHENDFPILVNAQINRRNLNSFAETMDYFDKLGVKTLRYIRTTEVPRWVLNAGDASLTYQEYYDAMLDVLRKFNEKERKMDLILWEFAIVNPGSKTFALICNSCPADEYRDTMPACGTVRHQICVGASGRIYPCSQMSGICDSRNLEFGNVKTDGLQSLLQASRYLDYALMTTSDIEKNNEKCASCEHFKQCHGGCRGLAYLYTGKIYGENPRMCELIEMDYESKVQEILKGWHNRTVSPGHDTPDIEC